MTASSECDRRVRAGKGVNDEDNPSNRKRQDQGEAGHDQDHSVAGRDIP